MLGGRDDRSGQTIGILPSGGGRERFHLESAHEIQL